MNHGHVTPNPDGSKARCGGPALCSKCAQELAEKERLDKSKPMPDVTTPAPKDRMLQFFEYKHLPPRLQDVSKPFCDLAHQLVETLPSNPERTVALRKLLEAKDCAVRALLYMD